MTIKLYSPVCEHCLERESHEYLKELYQNVTSVGVLIKYNVSFTKILDVFKKGPLFISPT